MIDYLFFKFFKAAQKSSISDIAEFASAVWLAGTIGINIMNLGVLLAKIDITPFFLPDNTSVIIFFLVLMGLSLLYFFYQKKYEKIINKYSSESNKRRVPANTFAIVYLMITFIGLIVVALFKPGYLPKI
jgi:hypothetical protein